MKRPALTSAALSIAAFVSSGAFVPVAAAQSNVPPPEKGVAPTPTYTPVRWNEDWSFLRDPARRTDFFDPAKYIPLGSDDTWLSLGGQLRERFENFDNPNFGGNFPDDDGYFLHRGLFHADLHLGPGVRFFGQAKFAIEDGEVGGPRGPDGDEFDVQQAFVDAKVPLPFGPTSSTTVRFGRQDLLYGAQRLISPLDWVNTRRTFEGLKVSNQLGPHLLDLFWVRPVIVDNEHPNDGDGNVSFAGVYDTVSLPNVIPGGNTKLDLYGLAQNRTEAPAIATQAAFAQDADTYTVGARFVTTPKPFDVDTEASYQFGKFGGADISAWQFAIESGYTFDTPLKPRPFLGFDIASGDDDPADNKFNRFNQLYPLGHAYFGYIDVIARQNIIDLHPGFDLALLENQRHAQKVTLRTEYHLFWRQSDDDGVFNAGGGLVRAAGGSDESFIGSEMDLLLNWQIDRHAQAYLGWSHFFAGGFIEATGPSEDIDFVYVAFQYTF